jgi:hypothetical protein
VHELLEQLPVAAAAVAPDLHQQALGVDAVAGVGQQHLQQAQLELGKPYRRAFPDGHGVLLEVEAEPSGRQR